MDSGPVILKLTGVGKDYGDFALRDVSFELPAGYIMGLIGPNGAGKTTLIRLIMNLTQRDAGQIQLFGEDNIRSEVEAKARIGFVYDVPVFFEHLSLRAMMNIIRPFYSAWDDAGFARLVDRFALPLEKPLKKLSHGMLLKASIAIALSHHAELVIMDEPTSGLDPVFRRELLDLLREILLDERKSILFSTHITSDLERIADYITFIRNGRIVFSETKDTVFERFVVVKGGLAELDGELRSRLQGVRTNDFGFEGLADEAGSLRKSHGDRLLIEPANLDDIMFYSRGEKNDDITA